MNRREFFAIATVPVAASIPVLPAIEATDLVSPDGFITNSKFWAGDLRHFNGEWNIFDGSRWISQSELHQMYKDQRAKMNEAFYASP
jgi:hypothetical protein